MQRVYIAAVHAADGIRHVAVATSEAAIVREIREYVQEHASRLWPEDAARVETLLRAGRTREAADAYFASIGARWDPERLHRETLTVA